MSQILPADGISAATASDRDFGTPLFRAAFSRATAGLSLTWDHPIPNTRLAIDNKMNYLATYLNSGAS
jgi:hypothetical protein